MLNKELLMGNTRGQQPVALTVGRKRIGTSLPRAYEYGYDRYDFGALSPVPFWGDRLLLNWLKTYKTLYTVCDAAFTITVYVSGYHDSPIRSGETVKGDIFEFGEKLDQTVYLTFDPPPPTVIWIPRHSNLSRRLLRRRRSLGGSRC